VNGKKWTCEFDETGGYDCTSCAYIIKEDGFERLRIDNLQFRYKTAWDRNVPDVEMTALANKIVKLLNEEGGLKMEEQKNEYVLQAIVKSEDCVYVKGIKCDFYTNTINLSYFLIDDCVPVKTNEQRWFRVNSIPKSLKIKGSDKSTNYRFTLKNGITPSALLPEKIESEGSSIPEEYENVAGCYKMECDTIPGEWEERPFTLEIIYKSNDFEWLKTVYPHQHFLLDQIECPSDLLDSIKPCIADRKQMYTFIRDYIKKNINPKVASITSDYDFVFTVARDVKLYEPIHTERNAGTSKRPKWVNDIKDKKTIMIYSITTEASYLKGGCHYPDPVIGKNAKDLDEKINKTLEEIMKEINKEFCECPTCKGWGYVEVK